VEGEKEASAMHDIPKSSSFNHLIESLRINAGVHWTKCRTESSHAAKQTTMNYNIAMQFWAETKLMKVTQAHRLAMMKL